MTERMRVTVTVEVGGHRRDFTAHGWYEGPNDILQAYARMRLRILQWAMGRAAQ